MRNNAIGQAVIIFLLLSCGGPKDLHAQTAWKPNGNVEFVVGAGAGGENDRIARAIQHALTKEHLVDTMTVSEPPWGGADHRHQLPCQQEGRRQHDRLGVRELHQRYRAE